MCRSLVCAVTDLSFALGEFFRAPKVKLASYLIVKGLTVFLLLFLHILFNAYIYT